MGRLEGKRAVIIGASKKDNMGQVMARRFRKEGAQVVIESISEEKRSVNSSGLAFLPPTESATGAEAIAALQTALGSAAPLRVTCFADSLGEAESARNAAAKAFPKLTGVFVQSSQSLASGLPSV